MKKSIIAAGAASIALAAMPVLGVFATDDGSVVDTFELTLSNYCIFVDDAATDHEYEDTMTAGVLWTSPTDTDPMVITCSQAYTLTPEFTDLADSNLSAGTEITYVTSAAEATAGSQKWSASYAKTGDGTDGSGVFQHQTAINGAATTSEGHTYTVTYKVGPAAAQPAGTYEGSATYTLQHSA
jgi:hypothetical protein